MIFYLYKVPEKKANLQNKFSPGNNNNNKTNNIANNNNLNNPTNQENLNYPQNDNKEKFTPNKNLTKNNNNEVPIHHHALESNNHRAIDGLYLLSRARADCRKYTKSIRI